MMIFWLKQNETRVNGDLLNADTLIKTNVSMVVYWMMIFWLKQSDTWVNGGLCNDDILISKYQHSINHYWHGYHFDLVKISSFKKPPLTQVSLCFNQNIIIQKTTIATFVLIKISSFNGGLLNDDILIKTKWYLSQWWFIEWWYLD
jgi:hypothetical protein